MNNCPFCDKTLPIPNPWTEVWNWHLGGHQSSQNEEKVVGLDEKPDNVNKSKGQ